MCILNEHTMYFCMCQGVMLQVHEDRPHSEFRMKYYCLSYRLVQHVPGDLAHFRQVRHSQ